MKLKELITSLTGSKSRPPATKITVTFCMDRKQEFSNFLIALQHSTTLTEITIRSDFLTDLTDGDDDDDNDNHNSSTSSLLDRFLNVLTQLDTLEELEICSSSRFHIDLMPARAFQLFPRHLKRLILEDFQVTAAHTSIVQALAVALSHTTTTTTSPSTLSSSSSSSASSSSSSLVQVSLNNFFANDYSNTGEVPYVLDPLIYALATIPNLQHLELTGCGSHALADAQVSPLISPACLTHFLQQRAFTLQTLELSFLEFQEAQFQAITSTLQQVPNQTTTTTITTGSPSSSPPSCYALQTLHLNYHKWSPTSFEQLMTAMCWPAAPLQYLNDISVRSLATIGTTGYQQALHMLQHNYTCTSLAVTATPFQQAQLDLYVRLNQAGRHLLRSTGTSGSTTTTLVQWINVLARCSHDIDVTRHLLAEVPSLCAYAAWNSTTRNNNNSNNNNETKENTIQDGGQCNLKHVSAVVVGCESNTAATVPPTMRRPKANSIPIITPAA
jgi:hypothetical protein